MGGGGKETPRQKMIGMMYLVLTALLALNVTDTVLNAFQTINEGLKATNKNFDQKNEFTMQAFQSALKNNEAKTRPFYDKAMQAKKLCKELDDYIAEIQKELDEFGHFVPEKGEYENKKDYDKVGEIMVGEVGPHKGVELKKRINDTRQKLYDLLDEKGKKEVVISLEAKDLDKPQEGSVFTAWEEVMFHGVPLVAGMSLLSKIQNDVRNAEADMVKYFMKEIDANDFKFDKLSAVAVAPSSVVLAGQPYEADVFLTASDSKKDLEITVGGSRLKVEEGKGKYTTSTGKPGFFKWKGIINVKKPNGEMEQYETEEIEYLVTEPTCNVSADQMNVFYVGVDNPVSISAGFPKEKLDAVLEGNGALTKQRDGQYIARVNNIGKAKITVYYTPKPGERKSLGTKEFRLKAIPSPIPKFAGINNGKQDIALMKLAQNITVPLEAFDFPAKFVVTKFRFGLLKRSGDLTAGDESSSERLTQTMLDAIQGMKTKEKIFIDEISVRDPAGNTRKLPTSITIEGK